MFERRAAMATLLANRPKNLVVVPGLGSCTWDAFAAGDDDRNFYLWGAMGGAAMIGLGLALAQPRRRVAVITGDGEMLMGMGALATIGLQKPSNLSIVVLDPCIDKEQVEPPRRQAAVQSGNLIRIIDIGNCLGHP